MFRIRTRKIIGDLWARKMRTLLAATSVFIGVFGVISLSSAGEILVRQLEKDLQQDRLAMIRSAVVLKRDTTVDNTAVLELTACPARCDRCRGTGCLSRILAQDRRRCVP